jgi:hypothetical protein
MRMSGVVVVTPSTRPFTGFRQIDIAGLHTMKRGTSYAGSYQ